MNSRAILLGARLVQLFLMFLVVKVQSTLLNPDQLAQVSLILAANAFFALVLLNPVGTFYNRHLNAWHTAGNLYPAVVRMLMYLGVLTVLAVFLYSFISMLQVSDVFKTPLVVLLASGLFLSASMVNFLLPSLNLLGKDKAFCILLVFNALLLLCLPVLFFKLGYGSVINWLTGLCVAGVATVVPLWVAFKRQVFQASPTAFKKVDFSTVQILRFALPVLMSTLMLWVVFHAYRFLVEYRVGLTELGLVFAGYGLCVQLFGAAEVLMNSIYMPKLYRDSSVKSQRSETFSEYFLGLLTAYSVGLFVILTGSEYLMKLLLGPSYQSVGQYIQIGAAIEFLRVQANAVSFRYHLDHKTTGLVTPAFVFMAVFAAMSLVVQSAMGVLIAMCCATAIYFVLLVIPYSTELLYSLRSDRFRFGFLLTLLPLGFVCHKAFAMAPSLLGAASWGLVSAILCGFVIKRYLLRV